MGCEVVVEGASRAGLAQVRELFERYDSAFSRFRPDSELARLNAAGGGAMSPLFRSVLDVALWAYDRTDALVDPCVGAAVVGAGYDRDFALGLDSGNFLENKDLHVHVPAGAVPKDGPSAGVTMYTALVSLLTGVPVRPDVAMTGEITLRGNVLQIGGLKEKLLAAHRAGIRRVIIPDRNVKDLIDVPDEVKREMEILSVKRMDEVLALALKDPPPSIIALAKAAQLETQVTA
jgi:hypothetical protein